MGLLRTILLAPVKAPLDGTLWVASKIEEAATTEMHDPARIRADLRALETALVRGEITEDEYDDAEEILISRLQVSS